MKLIPLLIPFALAASMMSGTAQAAWYQPFANCISMEEFIAMAKLPIKGVPHTPDEFINLSNASLSEVGLPNRYIDVTADWLPGSSPSEVRAVQMSEVSGKAANPLVWVSDKQACWRVNERGSEE